MDIILDPSRPEHIRSESQVLAALEALPDGADVVIEDDDRSMMSVWAKRPYWVVEYRAAPDFETFVAAAKKPLTPGRSLEINGDTEVRSEYAIAESEMKAIVLHYVRTMSRMPEALWQRYRHPD